MLEKLQQTLVKMPVSLFSSAAIVVLSATLISGCAESQLFSNPNTQTQRQNNVAPETVQNVSVKDVSEKTNDLVGKNVIVRSKIGQKIGGTVFTMTDNQLFGGEPILVINYTGKPISLPAGQPEVQVTGTVAKFIIPELQRDFDLKLDPSIYRGYEGKPAIVAQSVAVVR